MKNIATRTTIIAAALAACLTSSAFARLGDTEAQIEQRYGKSFHTVAGELPMKMYRHADFIIGVVYINGRSEAELYRKSDDNTDLSGDEITVLMQANSDGKEWRKTDGAGISHDIWLRDGASCTHSKFINHGLMIASTVFSKANDEANKHEAEKKLSGF